MNIHICTEDDRDRFNDFVATFDSGDLLQSYEWGDLKSRSGWKPIRVCAEQDGRIVASASILKRQIPRIGRCIMYIPRGPVLNTQDRDTVSTFCAFLKSLALKHKAILIKIDPPVPATDTQSEANLRFAGFQPFVQPGFGGTQPTCVMQLDLIKDIDAIFESFKPKWRYNIRLAEKKGVVVRTDCGKADIPAFYTILRETCNRDGFLVRGLRYFEDMWDILSRAGYIKLVLTYYEGIPIAGALAYRFGDKACYTYGASSNAHRNVMPNHLMQWTLIKLAKDAGCKWYDFRGVSPRKDGDSEDKLQGLNRFKDGFSPRFVEYIGEYDLPLSHGLYWLWNYGRKVHQLMKDRSRSSAARSAVDS